MNAIAPQTMEPHQVTVEDHDVIRLCETGDILRVAINIGSGGGHRLIVQGFDMKIYHKKLISADFEEEANGVGESA